jgi:Flp pilus assembly protein TadD
MRSLLSKPLAALTLLATLAIPSAAAPPKPKGAGKPATPAQGPPPEVTQAIQMYQQGNLPGAIALLEPLRKNPGAHPAALSLLGTLYLEAGRAKDSLAVLAPIAESGAAGPVILQTTGRAALATGQMDKAIDYLQRAVAKAPVSPASRDLGLLLGSQNRIAESYRLLRPWVQEHGDDQEARLSAAYGALELDRVPEAAELIAGLPAEDPRGRLLRGRLQLLQQDPRKTVETLSPLRDNAPPELALDFRRYLAEAHLALGESAEAIALLQGKIGNDPSLALLLARAQYRAGDPAQAVAVLEPFARQFLPKNPETPADRSVTASLAREYGQALIATSKWPEAAAALETATRLEPNNLQAWQLLGRAQLAAGHRDEATKSMAKFQELQRAEKSNSERVNEFERDAADPTGRNLQQAAGLAAAGKTDQALAAIRQEIALVPADPRPRVAEVTTLMAAGRLPEALKAAEASAGAVPGKPDFLVPTMNDLASLLLKNGKKDEARGLLRKVLAIKPGDPAATESLKLAGG